MKHPTLIVKLTTSHHYSLLYNCFDSKILTISSLYLHTWRYAKDTLFSRHILSSQMQLDLQRRYPLHRYNPLFPASLVNNPSVSEWCFYANGSRLVYGDMALRSGRFERLVNYAGGTLRPLDLFDEWERSILQLVCLWSREVRLWSIEWWIYDHLGAKA